MSAFGDRMKGAREILERNALLKRKCPEWYAVMLDVALGEGWDRQRAETLTQEATAFEPTYDAYYRKYALYLFPKWYGADGDTERFAQQSADRLGGADGDILYFQIAKTLVCTCENPQFSHMSWERIKKGFDELGKKYGLQLLESFLLQQLVDGVLIFIGRVNVSGGIHIEPGRAAILRNTGDCQFLRSDGEQPRRFDTRRCSVQANWRQLGQRHLAD